MRHLVAIALLTVATATQAQQANHAGHTGWDDVREASSLATNIDTAIRACGTQVVEKSPEARATQQTLEAKGTHFSSDAPDLIRAVASGKFGEARYHHWFDPHASIWIVAYTATEACRVNVIDTKYSALARPELERLIQMDGFWQKDTEFSSEDAMNWSSVFNGNVPEGAPVSVLMKLQGRLDADSDGTGIQIAALIALARK